MKNELIVAQKKGKPQTGAALKLQAILDRVGLPTLIERFFVPPNTPEISKS